MPMPRANLLRARARQRCRTSPGHRACPWGWSRPRSRSRCGSRYRCRSWCAALDGRLNSNRHRRSCFEEVDCRIGSLRRLVSIEPKVVQCSPNESHLRFDCSQKFPCSTLANWQFDQASTVCCCIPDCSTCRRLANRDAGAAHEIRCY